MLLVNMLLTDLPSGELALCAVAPRHNDRTEKLRRNSRAFIGPLGNFICLLPMHRSPRPILQPAWGQYLTYFFPRKRRTGISYRAAQSEGKGTRTLMGLLLEGFEALDGLLGSGRFYRAVTIRRSMELLLGWGVRRFKAAKMKISLWIRDLDSGVTQ